MPGKKRVPKLNKVWTRIKPSDASLARLKKISPQKSSEAGEDRVRDEMASGGGAAKKGGGGKADEDEIQGLYKEIRQMKAELSSMFKTSVTEISSQLDKQMIDLKQENRDIKANIGKLEATVSKIPVQMAEVAKELNQVSATARKNETQIKQHQQDIEALKRRMIYMEDNSRRMNVKLMNFEVQKTSDVKEEVEAWMNNIMGEQAGAQVASPTLGIERAHFVGNPKIKQSRPILVKFASYAQKDQFMKTCKGNPQVLTHKSKPVQVYQDLSKETMDWRRSMKPITVLLAKHGIRYMWAFPTQLRIWKGTTQYRISSVEEGQELLKAWNIIEDEASTSQAAVATP